jgi:hypothetical protein
MAVANTLAARREELHRRVEALPVEVETWQTRARDLPDYNANFSQVQAVGILMGALVARQRELLKGLDATGPPAAFGTASLSLVSEIIKSQKVWDFFRSKLDLRFVPTFQGPLWLADTVAFDCHRPVLETAAGFDIIAPSAFREPPLTYLTAEFSPATWVRGSRPSDGRNYQLGTARLPIPVIEVPWDHVENVWEFLSLHHEVGHDLEADLNLRAPLEASLIAALTAAGVPAVRVNVWQSWLGEVFPDLVGLQLGGPAFAEALMHLLLLPAADVTTYDAQDPHPTHYPRILMNTAYIRTLHPDNPALGAHADQIEEVWTGIYGRQPQFDPHVGDFPHVFKALMDTAFPILKGKTVRELMPYTKADDARIRLAAGVLAAGAGDAGKLRPRHCVSAARLAVTRVAADTATLAGKLEAINKQTAQLIRDNAPPGVRGGDDSAPHRKFIADFADAIPDL